MDGVAAEGGKAPYLVATSLTKFFGTYRALSDITFSLARGEFVCFLGPSGCGKTTLLRCIAGLETQTEGGIHIDGRDISWLPPSQRDFGIVFQSYALFPNITVAANVGFGLVNQRLGRDAVQQRVDELLGLVDLSGHAAKYPAQLSGGEQQRVALARALAPSPGLLLLDEPLSALDAKVRARLRREIREIHDRLGVTTIMVTHDQEEAQTMADRIFVLNAGRIEQMGHAERDLRRSADTVCGRLHRGDELPAGHCRRRRAPAVRRSPIRMRNGTAPDRGRCELRGAARRHFPRIRG